MTAEARFLTISPDYCPNCGDGHISVAPNACRGDMVIRFMPDLDDPDGATLIKCPFEAKGSVPHRHGACPECREHFMVREQ